MPSRGLQGLFLVSAHFKSVSYRGFSVRPNRTAMGKQDPLWSKNQSCSCKGNPSKTSTEKQQMLPGFLDSSTKDRELPPASSTIFADSIFRRPASVSRPSFVHASTVSPTSLPWHWRSYTRKKTTKKKHNKHTRPAAHLPAARQAQAHTHTNTLPASHPRMQARMHTLMNTHSGTLTTTQSHTHTQTYTHAHAQARTHPHIPTNPPTHTHTHGAPGQCNTHTHTHTHMRHLGSARRTRLCVAELQNCMRLVLTMATEVALTSFTSLMRTRLASP